MMQLVLKTLFCEITEETIHSTLTERNLAYLSHWRMNGGDVTLDSFRALETEERVAVMEYLDELSAYEIVKTDAGRFILVHAGLGNFDPGRSLDDYTIEELTFMRPDFDRRYFKDTYVVCGHTPTPLIWGSAEIYRKYGNIAIDCGAGFGMPLGCIRLDDFKEFYVL